MVYKDSIDMTKEWSAYTLEEVNQRERVGPPIMGRSKENMYTNFAFYKDGLGKVLSLDSQKKMKRLQRQNMMVNNASSQARNLKIAKNVLRMIVEKMNLGNGIYEESLFLYKKALDKDLIKGKSIDGFVAASVLAVIREMNLPRSLVEVSRSANIEPVSLSKFYRELVNELGLKMPLDNPSKYIAKICSKLSFDPQVEKNAVEILTIAKKEGLIQGKRPKAIAAAALYISAKRNYLGITQKNLAKASEVSEVTLRNRIKELKTSHIS